MYHVLIIVCLKLTVLKSNLSNYGDVTAIMRMKIIIVDYINDDVHLVLTSQLKITAIFKRNDNSIQQCLFCV